MKQLTLILLLLALALTLGAAPARTTPALSNSVPATVQSSLNRFDPARLKAHDRFLSDDLLEGRGPGTRGDDIAMAYMASEFEQYGLLPAGDDGTYYQKVPLLGVTTQAEKSSIAFTKPDGSAALGPLTYLDQWVGTDESQNTSSSLDSDVVFVGHGVVAPEYRWDDYKGLDTHGKTLIMLVDDPPASSAEPDLFKGKTRTYYGRWTYKYEIGGARGAAAVILIHTNEAAGYPWEVVRNSWGREKDYVKLQPGQPSIHMAAWITEAVARSLMQSAGQDLDTLTRQAASRDFRPVPLNLKLHGNLVSTIRSFNSANIVAKLPGSDPKLRDEAVLYTAHHDHLGIGKPKNGDSIYNGAIDNASGCAVLLEMARVWSLANPKPKRSILFSAVAAEEQGLLGSAYLGQNPPVPAGRIAVDINYDSVFEMGKVRNVIMTGVERTTFYPTAQQVTRGLGLRIDPDEEPEQGHYYRSDHFSLGKVGIPAFSIEAGADVIGQPAGYGKQQRDFYRENNYHQPTDEFDPKWDWSEGVQMSKLGFWLGWEAAQAPAVPNWLPGDEFRAARDKSLKGEK
jgi:Zn-dependent M28 family amino/carboxypeptidase